MEHPSRKVLIVEDEEDIAESIKYNLEKEGGFAVTVARTGETGLALARQKEFDLIILDVMLPGIDGLQVCREIRATSPSSHVPILMLTARAEETDKLVGLELGADDYLTKPFSMRELLARAKAQVRRSARERHSGSSWIRDEGLEIDIEGHRLWLDGRETSLTRMEFALLAALVKSRGRVLTRDRLLETVWGYDQHVSTRTVDVHVRRLRRKLRKLGDRIETVFGVGYRFRGAADRAASD